MEKKTIKINSLDELSSAAREFVAMMGDYTVFAFYGKMGLLTTLNDGKPLNIKTGF